VFLHWGHCVFCGICDNHGIYGNSWIAVHFDFVSGDFHTFPSFSAKFGRFGWNMTLVRGEADFMVVSRAIITYKRGLHQFFSRKQ